MANENKAPSGARGSQRARLGLSAKAGRRKVYTTGKRKTKDLTPKPGYVMADKHPREEMVETIRMAELRRPTGNYLKSMLKEIDKMEHNTSKISISDPFMFDRMRAHARAGIFNPMEKK